MTQTSNPFALRDGQNNPATDSAVSRPAAPGRRFSPITSRLPHGTRMLGYAAIMKVFGLRCPAPRTAMCGATGTPSRVDRPWTYVDRKVADRIPELTPDDPETLALHLGFALRHEGTDLAVLSALFRGPHQAHAFRTVEHMVREAPTGTYPKRVWFLAEWLTGRQVDLPDAKTGNYVEAIDPEQYHALVRGDESRRHRVRDNLPGVPEFCPLVRRDPLLGTDLYGLGDGIARAAQSAEPQLLRRAARLLSLKEAKASFAIEANAADDMTRGGRIDKWSEAISAAGASDVDPDHLIDLNNLLGTDRRFTSKGFREGVSWAGSLDSDGDPWPELIGASSTDIPRLMSGICKALERMKRGRVDAVVAAAAASFGAVFVRPFADGNYRTGRWLITHALGAGGLVPDGLVLPISSAFERHLDAYRLMVAEHSSAAMDCIDWTATPDGDIEIPGETSDLYSFFDATPFAHFLALRVREAIRDDLPAEITWVRRLDATRSSIKAAMPSMSDQHIDLFIRAVAKTGSLSESDRDHHFGHLRGPEIRKLTGIVRERFDLGQRTTHDRDIEPARVPVMTC